VTTLGVSEVLRLIDGRAAAFRAAVDAASGLDVRVPTCPEWTLFELAQHIGQGRRFWAAVVGAGPADGPGAEAVAVRAAPAPEGREELRDWLAESPRLLLDALRAAGPDGGCWTWWGPSQSPRTSGAVARHQLQEIAVHTYDAQAALGAPQPLPAEVALDGVEEFLSTCVATTSPWPHTPTAFDFHAAEGRAWRLTVDGDGARVAPLPGEGAEAPGVSVHGTASDLVLFIYDRIPATGGALDIRGDAGLIDLLRAWEPEE
jgi:uncharacterized protein (TIGR03083 family)